MRQVRIFVSCPGDWTQERARLDEALERFNRSELERNRILLRTSPGSTTSCRADTQGASSPECSLS